MHALAADVRPPCWSLQAPGMGSTKEPRRLRNHSEIVSFIWSVADVKQVEQDILRMLKEVV